MDVLGRNEINRMRLVSTLAGVMALAVLFGGATRFSSSPELARIGLLGLGLLAIVTLIIATLQVASRHSRSKIILFQRGTDTVVATNKLHDGFKLRFLRDILSDAVTPFSDTERGQWNLLRNEGFHPVFVLANVRKTLLLPVCSMIFDEVYVFDHTKKWDYYDCTKTSDPTFSQRGISPFRHNSFIPPTEKKITAS